VPSVAEVLTPAVECGAQAAACFCGLTPGHSGPHECGRASCDGSWIGTIDHEDFFVIRYPGVDLGLEAGDG
jgi:sugar phosphate isomerase/epimerase